MRYRCARGGNTFSLDEHLPRRDDSAIDYIEQPRGMQHDAVWRWGWRFLSQSRA
jgi:hypothetical protein